MRTLRNLSVTLPLAGAILLAPLAIASPWNKKTNLTVHETIQIPGAVLPPGKYVVKLAESSANRHIVQFFNEEQSKIYSTILAIPNQRMNSEVTGDTQLLFYETRGNEPPALRAWFYPGDSFGQEFVYPKSESQIIARNAGRYVPTLDDDGMKQLKTRSTAESAADLPSETRLYVWGPDGKEGTNEQAMSQSEKMDRDEKWRTWQRANRRFGGFNTVVVTRGDALPSTLTSRMTEIQSIMGRIEQHGDMFEKRFEEALSASTVKFEDREDLENMVGRLEDGLDDLKEAYDANKLDEAHKHLRRTLEVAASVNRFMLRSEFGNTEEAWGVVRDDLNKLAAAHTYPEIQIFSVRNVPVAGKR